MLKYAVGQEFRTNRFTQFPEGVENLGAGALFKIRLASEYTEYGKLEYPYLVRFSNGYEISLDEHDIKQLTEITRKRKNTNL